METYLNALTPGIKDLVFALETDKPLLLLDRRNLYAPGAADLLDLVMFMKDPDHTMDHAFIGEVLYNVKKEFQKVTEHDMQAYNLALQALIDTWQSLTP